MTHEPSEAEAVLLQAMAHPTRLAILRALADHKRCVSALNESMPEVSQVCLSQHLAVLRKAGLVAVCAQGTKRCYSLAQAAPVRSLLKAVSHAAGQLQTTVTERE